jgi:putative phosphoribosyl transferase
MFRDRADAGRELAHALESYRSEDPVILGLPRGGIPLAAEVARALDAPLDVIVVRKLGVPRQPELAMGAIGEDRARVLNELVLRRSGVTEDELAEVELRERRELDHRLRVFRRDRPPIDLQGRVVVIVDDGLATGATARAACQIARHRGAARVVLAVPVGARDTVEKLKRDADEVICLEVPQAFMAVGQAYGDFSQVTDDEVVTTLASMTRLGVTAPEDVSLIVPIGDIRLAGHLRVPAGAKGMVVFAHGSGSSRHSPRNQHVADVLNEAGLGTFLFDLLTVAEERQRSNVFDVHLLGERLLEATLWLSHREELHHLPFAYFGASTGAAAALWAAADPRVLVSAVVSRGGRPDLTGYRLREVKAPTLLIVGSRDEIVLELNRKAQTWLEGESELAIIPGATHLFEESGTLDLVAASARDWFLHHLD